MPPILCAHILSSIISFIHTFSEINISKYKNEVGNVVGEILCEEPPNKAELAKGFINILCALDFSSEKFTRTQTVV